MLVAFTSVVIRPTGTAALWGKVQEVRDAITDFKQSGKPIIAFMEYGGEQEFYLASACDKVFLLPTASLDLTGIASYELFLRGKALGYDLKEIQEATRMLEKSVELDPDYAPAWYALSLAYSRQAHYTEGGRGSLERSDTACNGC